MAENDAAILLDCTLRDGGYYNSWDFSPALVSDYLAAVQAAGVDIVELGFRFLKNDGYKGPCAYTTDAYLKSLDVPSDLTVAVMVNGSDLCTEIGCIPALERLFPATAGDSPVDVVRLACHFRELSQVLPGVAWLHKRGYRVGLNLMQIADRSQAEVEELGKMASATATEVLYFADSMGSMTPEDATRIIGWLRTHWNGPLGIHAHDNMGLALSNTLAAQRAGVRWLDATVTGMGRGPGNTRSEDLVIEAESFRGPRANLVPLMALIHTKLGPMKAKYGWGTNPYYHLAGKYGLHPTYIQSMLDDTRYSEEDVLAVIEHLVHTGGKSFSLDALTDARIAQQKEAAITQDAKGSWSPAEAMAGREVLLLGTGPGASQHRDALEHYIRRAAPLVLSLNTDTPIAPELIDFRLACHPLRILADAETHARQDQPLITPKAMISEGLRAALTDKTVLDYGLDIVPDRFEFHAKHCVAPAPLVLAYALAVVTSGQATRVLMAGFDGYPAGDLRNAETEAVLEAFRTHADGKRLLAVTPTCHRLLTASIYYPDL